MRCVSSKQQGMSLIELMIAMTIGLILLTGVLQIALRGNQNYRMHEASSRVQESGRFAMDLLSRDIRMADFWGCAKSITQITNNLDPAGDGYANFTFTGGIGGTDGASGDPDTITLAGAFGDGLFIEPPYGPQESANVKVSAGNDLEQADIVLVSDCLMGDIFQISNANPGTSGTVVHNTGSATEPGNYNPGACGHGANSHCLSKVYEGDAQLYKLQTIAYSIATSPFNEPVLTRSANGATAVRLVEGVENMQFLYGEDTNNDNNVDTYRTATNVADWEAVINVKISLLIRSPESVLDVNQTYEYEGVTITSSDKRLRRVFTGIVTLRNRTL